MVFCGMPDPIPPRSVKENQHFVPRSWISRFAGDNGRLFGLQNGAIKHQIKVADIMSQDWLYTVFDEWWRPSDCVEDALAKVEGDVGVLFDALHATASAPSTEQWVSLCRFMALTASRHPDTMRHGHERAKEMSWALADADKTYGCRIVLREYPVTVWGRLAARHLQSTSGTGPAGPTR
jgi:hypothetical protein